MEEDEEILDQATIDRLDVSEKVSVDVKEKIAKALSKVEDPELGMDIVNLGLVYRIDMYDNRDTKITMTLTAMGCPLAGEIVSMVKGALTDVEEVNDVEVDVVWNPPWSKDMMSRMARLALRV